MYVMCTILCLLSVFSCRLRVLEISMMLLLLLLLLLLMLLTMMMMTTMMMITYPQVCPFYAHDADYSGTGPLHTSSHQGGKPQSDTPRFTDVGKGYSPIKCVWRSLRVATQNHRKRKIVATPEKCVFSVRYKATIACVYPHPTPLHTSPSLHLFPVPNKPYGFCGL